ncbi:MAG: PEP-CTERM sorting domain-containing protein [Thermodesulfobacteriota bacterium]
MKPRLTPSSLVLCLLLLALSTTARATAITAAYSFTATDFGAAAPQAVVSGSFTATFSTISGNGPNADASLADVRLEILGQQYHCDNTGILLRNGRLMYNGDYEGNFCIGGKAGGVDMGTAGTNDFWLKFMDFGKVYGTDQYSGLDFIYWESKSGTSFKAKTVVISRIQPVPEAGTFWMLGSGLIALATAGFHHRRSS